eukprot:CAMPEP_0198235910 /NCGR_PEP_ID=MMETSP1446-20131203/1807_1 /TAXON_ID=1461542 ORGANISM="Unidentified sp, Strain CCMP2111" /NCGR_SAMPLE_ID=MMETSP1446 /ASSEMBLY_ACC=CAM_ASM_001112 /LENGTH=102 /DNA_ID=CAMNT_0043917355 /DNA_START=10 /DNA_END=318 /DNA_ORIENTATION=+
MGSMYVRVKRGKTTYFVHVEPSVTILELKQKLQELTEKMPEQQRLLKDDTVLEDAKSLADCRIENDDVIALTFHLEDGTFEEVMIETLDKEDAPAENAKEEA